MSYYGYSQTFHYSFFLLSVIRNMRGCSPFDNTLLLKQITETLILIALKVVQRFTLWFTLNLDFVPFLLLKSGNV